MKVVFWLFPVLVGFVSSAAGADLSAVIGKATSGRVLVPAGTTIGAQTISRSLKLVFDPGVYPVAGTITVQNVNGFSLEGSGASDNGVGGTIFKWQGNANDPMFNLTNVMLSSFREFSVVSAPYRPLATAFFAPNVKSVGGYLSSHDRFERIAIQGTGPGGLGYGFRFAVGNDQNQNNNNDAMAFDHIIVENFTTAAWSIEHSQSQNYTFHDITFLTGQYGITTALGAGANGGSFAAYGVNGGYMSGADFYLGSPDAAVLISGGVLEGSSRLLLTAGGSGGAYPVTIEGLRWSGGQLASDGCAVIYTQRGPLNLIGNTFENFGTTKALRLCLQPFGPSHATAIGNQIWSTLADPLTVNDRERGIWNSIGNVLSAPDGTASVLPSRLR